MDSPNKNDEIIAFPIIPSLICTFGTTICISDDRCLYVLGSNSHGKLGFDCEENKVISIPKRIDSLQNIKMVSCGYYFTVCCDFEGNVYAFGTNKDGELGIGNTILQTHIPQKLDIPPIDCISSGNYFSICLSYEKSLWSFGKNDAGQLGYNSSKFKLSIPREIPNLSEIEIVSCRGYHVISKTCNGEVYSWGKNSSGQLGCSKGILNPFYDSPQKCENFPNDIVSIKCGNIHSLVLTQFGYVYGFGSNGNGQLGINSAGFNNYKSHAYPTKIEKLPLIKRLESGYYHTICIDINDNLWVFGYNTYGQLGVGDTSIRSIPILLKNEQNLNYNIIDISCGGYHTFIKTEENEIYSFGMNTNSQLGKGNQNICTPLRVLEENEYLWTTNIIRSKQKSARK